MVPLELYPYLARPSPSLSCSSTPGAFLLPCAFLLPTCEGKRSSWRPGFACSYFSSLFFASSFAYRTHIFQYESWQRLCSHLLVSSDPKAKATQSNANAPVALLYSNLPLVTELNVNQCPFCLGNLWAPAHSRYKAHTPFSNDNGSFAHAYLSLVFLPNTATPSLLQPSCFPLLALPLTTTEVQVSVILVSCTHWAPSDALLN
jgi:hypothetical protein